VQQARLGVAAAGRGCVLARPTSEDDQQSRQQRRGQCYCTLSCTSPEPMRAIRLYVLSFVLLT